MRKVIQFTSVLIYTILFCFGIISGSTKAEASDIVIIEPEMEYGQTEARAMLQKINDFRTGVEAWVWNETNSEKITYSDLSELQYDYRLEQIAMQRAAEIAISYDHTRPNDERCFTTFGDYETLAYGENIAAGYRTEEEVFEGWQETEEPYLGQGHRRNMLSSAFNAIGIGHVYYAGNHYWVQEFGNLSSPDTVEVPAKDRKAKITIEVLSTNISNMSLKCSTENMTMIVGEKKPLPEVVVMAQIKEHWLGGSCPIHYPDNLTWISKNESVAIISAEGEIEAVSKGKTTMTASYEDLTVECNVTVSSTETSKEENKQQSENSNNDNNDNNNSSGNNSNNSNHNNSSNNNNNSNSNSNNDNSKQTIEVNKDFKFSEVNISMVNGQKILIDIPDSFSGKVKLISKNKKVATVSKKGVIKAKKKGKAKIVLKKGSKKAVLTITVK